MCRGKIEIIRMNPINPISTSVEPAIKSCARGNIMQIEIHFHAQFLIEFQIKRLEDVPLRSLTTEPWPVLAAPEQSASTALTVNLELQKGQL
jgi:hypothetical protein